jgi:hypothetical protein
MMHPRSGLQEKTELCALHSRRRKVDDLWQIPDTFMCVDSDILLATSDGFRVFPLGRRRSRPHNILDCSSAYAIVSAFNSNPQSSV